MVHLESGYVAGAAAEAPFLLLLIAALLSFGVGRGLFDCNTMPILRGIVSPRLSATGYGVLNLCGCVAGGAGAAGAGFLKQNVGLSPAFAPLPWRGCPGPAHEWWLLPDNGSFGIRLRSRRGCRSCFCRGWRIRLPVLIAVLISFGVGRGLFDCNAMPILRGMASPRLSAPGYGVLNLCGCVAGGAGAAGAGFLKQNVGRSPAFAAAALLMMTGAFALARLPRAAHE